MNDTSPKNNPELLKLTAITLMTIDHLGFIFDDNVIMRSLGRLALPLFIIQLIFGFYLTKNHYQSLKNLVTFAFISYLPYSIFLNNYYLFHLDEINKAQIIWNIFLPLSISYLCLMMIEIKNYAAVILLLAISFNLDMDYYWYVPVMTCSLFYSNCNLNNRSSFFITLLIFISINTIYCIVKDTNYIQLIAPLGVILAFILLNIKINFRLPKYFYYWFYPCHLMLLVIIKVLYEYK